MSDLFSEDLLPDNSTEAVSAAIGKVDQHFDKFPEANVNSLKKIAKCIPDKAFKKEASRHVSKCHKVSVCRMGGGDCPAHLYHSPAPPPRGDSML